MSTPPFKKHVFICTHSRADQNLESCAPKGSAELVKILREKIKALNLTENVRINAAGCLGACLQGAALVIYPDQIWHYNVKADDLDKVLSDIVG